MLWKLLSLLVPSSVKAHARRWVRLVAGKPSMNSILATLHDPLTVEDRGGHFVPSQKHAGQTVQLESGFPLPPPKLRQTYGDGDDEAYLRMGEETAAGLRAIMRDHGVELGPGDAMLDWGSSTGRVLRWFAEEARTVEVWGADVHADAMVWAKQHLSPPMHFVTCSGYPHLPFEDEKFTFIYSISVFTHLEHLIDLWLLEHRRILRPGGVAVFTVQDEYVIPWFEEHGREHWVPQDLDLGVIRENEVTILRSESWRGTHTFFRSDWIRAEWGRYFEVLEIRVHAEKYQSAVVLRRVDRPAAL